VKKKLTVYTTVWTQNEQRTDKAGGQKYRQMSHVVYTDAQQK